MQKYLGGLLVLVVAIIVYSSPAHAIDTIPSEPVKVDGPLLITAYSFQGHNLRYVQIYNDLNEITDLQGWRIGVRWTGGGSWLSEPLTGYLEPKKKALVADSLVVTLPTFSITQPSPASDPRLIDIRLIPPDGSLLNEHVVTPSINDTTGTSRTPRVESVPPVFYFSRNISSSTGNYLTTFTAFVPGANFSVEADPLYTLILDTDIRVTEIYPDAVSCAPNDTSALCYDYVKLYNGAPVPISLDDMRLRVGAAGQASSSSNTTYLSGTIPSGSYVVVKLNLTDSGSWVWLEDKYGLHRYDQTIVGYPSASSHEGWSWAYNNLIDTWQWTKYPTPYDAETQFSLGGLVNECTSLRLSEIAANVDQQFIEVVNTSNTNYDVSGCQLQTNRSQTASFVFPENTMLPANGYATIDIATTELELTKTTEGTVYVLNSDGTVEVDARSYQDLDENTSLSLVGGTWLQTFTITPSETNAYTEYPPCETGYERNFETGRCNKIEVATSLTPCLPTQYRSEETNRCRNIVSTSTSLTPCKPGQTRNPLTNRCRSSISAASSLKPCAPNQERNPLTNRCRTVPKLIKADFPVEAVQDTAEATLGWWAFGGVGLLAVGYAGWEWRHEVGQGMKRLFKPIASAK
ncbi:TPA: hypothetical protein DIV49_03065 [Candidatus Saccharibacteria bacterium]|nr:hypothetical protein [Candidatus Saccharibacteria bacterium]HRJ90687.1 lamin tail domain-containing protein [Candidatus Saccharibacteria bacterium]